MNAHNLVKIHVALNIVINLVNGILHLKHVYARDVNHSILKILAYKISLNVIGMENNANNLLPVHN